MIEEIAVVAKIENHQVWVKSGQNKSCGGCAQQSGCSTSLLQKFIHQRLFAVDSQIQLASGDQVVVAIDESILVRASLLLYMLPLLLMFAGGAAADWLIGDALGNAELWVVTAALSSLLFSLWMINKIQHVFFLHYCSRPVVVRKLGQLSSQPSRDEAAH